MHIQIAVRDDAVQLFFGMEADDGRVGELCAPAAQRGFQRAFAGDEQGDLVFIFGMCDRLDEVCLALFFHQPPRGEDAELAFEGGGLGRARGREYGVYPVGDDAQVLFVAVFAQLCGDEFGGAVDIVGIFIKPVPKIPVQVGVDLAALEHAEVAGHVFRLHMEGGGDGLMQLAAQAHGGLAERKGHQNVHHVAAFDAGAQHLFVGFCQRNAVFGEIVVEDLEVALVYGIVSFLAALVGRDHEHLVPALFQVTDQALDGDRGAVVLFAQYVCDDGDGHKILLSWIRVYSCVRRRKYRIEARPLPPFAAGLAADVAFIGGRSLYFSKK